MLSGYFSTLTDILIAFIIHTVNMCKRNCAERESHSKHSSDDIFEILFCFIRYQCNYGKLSVVCNMVICTRAILYGKRSIPLHSPCFSSVEFRLLLDCGYMHAFRIWTCTTSSVASFRNFHHQ